MTDESLSGSASLRKRTYDSGRLLVGRQLIGIGVRFTGILVMTRLIGPTNYGLFTAAAALAVVASTVATFGMDVQLVRAASPSRVVEDTAFTMLMFSSLLVAAAGLAIAPLFGSWLGDPAVVGPMRVIAAMVPVMVLWTPARARLERNLDFKALAAVELVADVIVYAVAVPLAFAGAGVWAPVAGFVARHVWLLVSVHVVAHYRPRPALRGHAIRSNLWFGAGYSAGRWVSITARLINPIVVGGVLGAEGVGYVGLASRLIEQLGAVKQATMRLATAALARLVDERSRLRAAHAEGMLVQMLGAVPLYAGAAFTAPWLVPLIFGQEWQSMVELLAFLAVAASIGTLFNLHASTLTVLGRHGPVARLRILQFAALAAGTMILVPLVGVAGYGLARLLRVVPFAVIHRDMASVFTPTYAAASRWLMVLLVPMASPWLPSPARPLLLVPVVIYMATPLARADLRFISRQLTGNEVATSA